MEEGKGSGSRFGGPHGSYGTASIFPAGDGGFEAGSNQKFTITYTAGSFGIDDLGGIKIVFKYPCDQSIFQVVDPGKVGYMSARASNGSTVSLRYEPRGNARPWFKTIFAQVSGGGLKEGETIEIFLGGEGDDAPGMLLQTFCERSFEFKILVDAFSTNTFIPIQSPAIEIVSGIGVNWHAVLPTLKRVNDGFRLSIKVNDRWGNPAGLGGYNLHFSSNLEVTGLPRKIKLPMDAPERALVIENLRVGEAGTVVVKVLDDNGFQVTESNPLKIEDDPTFLHFWGDLHGQSEETIGSNSARDYFEFARDCAFLDVISHQGNDFQVTGRFWDEINHLTAEFNEPGRFITIPGYEWSGNTAVGGDRNVYFRNEGCTIRRSSHALIPGDKNVDSDCHTASILFEELEQVGVDDVVVVPHVGGRWGDVKYAHDGRMEHSIEIHSAWGTFEWLLQDAFEMGFRVGIVANSDGHKGRPGASCPGASMFGTMGGLTCFLVEGHHLTRDSIFDALKRRHHYATTGTRIYLDVRVLFKSPQELYEKDPAIFSGSRTTPCTSATMGDIVRVTEEYFSLNVSFIGSSPVERVEIFDGPTLLETVRPFLTGASSPGGTPSTTQRKIRLVWEGAEYRARKRNTTWDCTVTFPGNEVMKAYPVNFWDVNSKLLGEGSDTLSWVSMTSGNFQAVDVLLKKPYEGTLEFHSNQVDFKMPLSGISLEDSVVECSSGLGKRVRVFRLPEDIECKVMNFQKEIYVRDEGESRIYVKITQEDGHQAWSSPIYLIS
ncbi:MAG: DUF3604 domain-containing protein [Promethearchaeota archaeon]